VRLALAPTAVDIQMRDTGFEFGSVEHEFSWKRRLNSGDQAYILTTSPEK
jgi:hypothetical protein